MLPTITELTQTIEHLRSDEPNALSCSDIAQLVTTTPLGGNIQHSAAVSLIGFVAGLRLNPEKREVLTVGRYPFQAEGLDALQMEQLDLLSQWLDIIQIPDLRARIADVLWLRRRPKDLKHASIAMNAYTASATTMCERDFRKPLQRWRDIVDRFARAHSLSKISREAPTITAAVQAAVAAAPSEGPCRARLMTLLLDHDVDAPTQAALAAQYATERAVRAAAEPPNTLGFHFSRELWDIARLWLIRIHGPDAPEVVDAAESHAMTYVEEADRAEIAGDIAIAASLLNSATESLRDIGRGDKAIGRLLQRSTSLAQRAPRVTISSKIDITTSVADGANAVRGLDILPALHAVARLLEPMPKKSTRAMLEEQNEGFIASKLLHSIIYAADGRRIGGVSPYNDDPESGEEATEQERVMEYQLRDTARYHRLFTIGRIRGAIDQINLEHSTRLHDLAPFVNGSHLVPPGHRKLFASGILFGLLGDFAAAVHILVPQLENCLRHFAEHHLNKPLLVQKPGGIQHVALMDRILKLPELEQCLGEDLIFDLRGFFLSSLDSNFRNALAHGLVGDSLGDSRDALYCWGLCICLCAGLTPLARADVGAPDPDNPEPEPASEPQVDPE